MAKFPNGDNFKKNYMVSVAGKNGYHLMKEIEVESIYMWIVEYMNKVHNIDVPHNPGYRLPVSLCARIKTNYGISIMYRRV